MLESDRIEGFELAELLARLDGIETGFEPDDSVRVQDVCELTGRSAEVVRLALASLRERDMRSRLAQALREIEAPLYSVERPGFAADPLAAWARTQTLQRAFPPSKK
ncbi:hypothetical protein BH11ARM1_BH11ARM1_15660 [soil metagenome]